MIIDVIIVAIRGLLELNSGAGVEDQDEREDKEEGQDVSPGDDARIWGRKSAVSSGDRGPAPRRTIDRDRMKKGWTHCYYQKPFYNRIQGEPWTLDSPGR